MQNFIYRGAKTKEISFPLGGIGSGCIGLAGNGRLIDWEIANRPNKGSINGFSHFSIKAEQDGNLLDARVLNGDLPPSYMGDLHAEKGQGFGTGPRRGTMAGVPHFQDVEFRGEFPFADLTFIDETFPGQVSMTAFNPFIPLNDKDSSIPAAFFSIQVINTGRGPVDYTVAMSLGNPFPAESSVNTYQIADGFPVLTMGGLGFSADDPAAGDICVATEHGEVAAQEYWYRGQWFDSLEVFWGEFARPGIMPARSYAESDERKQRGLSGHDTGTLTSRFTAGPGQTKSVRFVITWSYPNYSNYWKPETCTCDEENCCDQKPNTWKNYYSTLFTDSTASAVYALKNWDRLYERTEKFKKALFSTTIPEVALESISANLSVLKTPTCLRLTDGSFYGFEGCHCNEGCCEGSCTHVWNYAYVLPFLFPKLERSMRDLDFRYNQRPDGGMVFRLQLPVGRERSSFRPCADGQFGGVVKTYRDWKISGDTEWLKSIWPAVKKSIEYAWADTNEDRWDADRDGVLEGRQHHTLDMELFGPNSWLTGFYLAALKAGAEMAEYLGEPETASMYRGLFERGKIWVDTHLFNGEYYHQLVDLKDRTILEKFAPTSSNDVVETYWNDEVEEIKYQIAEGSEIDQVNAQWHANLCGLGDIFDPAQRKTALRSLFRINFKPSMRHHFNPCRLYCLNDEGGLVISDWPEGKYRPVVPLPYSGETQNGYEYQAAILMIQEGLVTEGLTAVKAIRERYDGEKRNPWNEFECGSNYARSMASYSMIPTFSGFEYDMVHGIVGFEPIPPIPDIYRTIWSLDCGWGVFEMTTDGLNLSVLSGQLTLSELRVPALRAGAITKVSLGGDGVKWEVQGHAVLFPDAVTIEEGVTLLIQ